MDISRAIGPGIVRTPLDQARETSFVESLKSIRCDPIKHTPLEPSHEPHGRGSHDLPQVITPEIFVDRNTHATATRAIMLIEAGLIKAEPSPSLQGSYVTTDIALALSGRVENIVRQRYVDAGWKSMLFTAVGDSKTQVTLYFP